MPSIGAATIPLFDLGLQCVKSYAMSTDDFKLYFDCGCDIMYNFTHHAYREPYHHINCSRR